MRLTLTDWSVVVVSLGVFVYLFYALLFPERF